ncbi:MAG: carbohydrate ABC transporter permease [Planctomycetota bacterium]
MPKASPGRRLTILLVLGVGALGMAAPFLWLILSSLKPEHQVFDPSRLLPYAQYVTVDDEEYRAEVEGREYGTSRIRIEEGPRAGEERVVPAQGIVAGRIDSESGERWRVIVLEEVEPTRVTVRLVSDGPLEGERVTVSAAGLREGVRPRFENYLEALTTFDFLRYLFNTLGVVALTILGTVLSCSLCGYAFARLEFPGRGTLFVLLLSTMMLPAVVTMIPSFSIFKGLGWLDTYLPLVVPAFFGNPFFIFLFRQFFKTIPGDLLDAARLDGCSEIGIYWRIVLPLAKPAIATVVIFTFLETWNDFLRPLIYLFDPMKFTLAVGLASFRSYYQTQWHLLMAAAAIMILPVLVLFFVGQKSFKEGVNVSGLKG